MMNVDVEGHEDAFIRGAANTISNASLKLIELESYSEESLSFLTGLGFERTFYDPINRTLSAIPIKGSKSNDIFVRDREFVAARLRGARNINVLGQLY